jgi:hypothetical protein
MAGIGTLDGVDGNAVVKTLGLDSGAAFRDIWVLSAFYGGLLIATLVVYPLSLRGWRVR